MSTSRRTTAGLAVASVFSLATLAVVPTAVGPAAGVTVAPAADCTTPYDGSSDDFAALVGQPVTGLTVVSGTAPEKFHGTVLGILDQGIDLATPLIMVRLGTHGITDGSTPTEADATIAADGVWEGMSGSPVYVGGKLVGAVSMGLANGNTDIIGLTPASSMVPFLPHAAAAAARTSTTWAHPTPALRRELARATGISPARAAEGLRPLTALTEYGMGPAALSRLHASKIRGLHSGLSTGRIASTTATTATSTAAPVSTMVAGGNVADMPVWGDYAEGGVGTVTTVCHGGLVAFGHPLDGTGTANDALLSASAVLIQPDPLGVSFKVANLGLTAGMVSQDVSTAIGGTFGAPPTGTVTFSHTASYDGHPARTGVSHAAEHLYWADAAYYAADANDYTVMKAWRPGGAVVSFRVTGTDHGAPFTLVFADRYASSGSIADDSLTDIGNVVEALSAMPGVALSKVTTTSALNDVRAVGRLVSVQQADGSSWQTVSSARPVLARAGHTAHLRVVVTVAGSTTYLPFSVSLPSSLRGGHGTLQLTGGNSTSIDDADAHTVAAEHSMLAGAVRNDEVGITGSFSKGATHASLRLRTAASAHVVGGHLAVPVSIG